MLIVSCNLQLTEEMGHENEQTGQEIPSPRPIESYEACGTGIRFRNRRRDARPRRSSKVKIPFPIRSIPSLTFQAWLTPPPLGTETADRDRAKLADLESGDVGGVPVFYTGEGPTVVLVHGWGGRPAQMAQLAGSISSAGFRAVVPALPGRAGGEKTDIKKAAAALGVVVEEIGEPHAVVGHSFAALVMRLAFADVAPSHVVFIAPALDVRDALAVFGEKLRLLPWSRSGLRSRLEAWDSDLWPIVSDLSPAQMPGASILILHDPADPETPFARSAQLAALRPDTAISVIEDAGHNRILSHPEALERVNGFLTHRSVAEARAG